MKTKIIANTNSRILKLIVFIIVSNIVYSQPTHSFVSSFDILPVKKQLILRSGLLFNHSIQYGLTDNWNIGVGTILTFDEYKYVVNLAYNTVLKNNYYLKINAEYGNKTSREHYDFNPAYFNFNSIFEMRKKKFTLILKFGLSSFEDWNYISSWDEIDLYGFSFNDQTYDRKIRPYAGTGIKFKLNDKNILLVEILNQSLIDSQYYDSDLAGFTMISAAYRMALKRFSMDFGFWRDYKGNSFCPKINMTINLSRHKVLNYE